MRIMKIDKWLEVTQGEGKEDTIDDRSQFVNDRIKCKICKEPISVHIFGAPIDICWTCLSQSDKDSIIGLNAVSAGTALFNNAGDS
jgi:hypothetical protein